MQVKITIFFYNFSINMNSLPYYQIYWEKINLLQENKSKYKKKNINKEETMKIQRAVDLCLENQEIIEGGCYLYHKNRLIRIGMNLVINYCLSSYQKYS